MLRMFAFLGLLASSAAASGQSLYKCTNGDKVSYATDPCNAGRVRALAVPPQPAPDPDAGRQLRHEQALLGQLQLARMRREEREQRAAAKADQAAAQRNRRCTRAALQKRWADDNLARATARSREVLQRKARQMEEAMAIECPG